MATRTDPNQQGVQLMDFTNLPILIADTGDGGRGAPATAVGTGIVEQARGGTSTPAPTGETRETRPTAEPTTTGETPTQTAPPAEDPNDAGPDGNIDLSQVDAVGGPVIRDVQENELVAGQLDKLLASENPIMQRARARAAETANERGLINSSFAAQAGEAAVIDAAMPIATADAGTYGRQAMANQGYENQALSEKRQGVIQAQLAQKGYQYQKSLNSQQNKFADYMATKQMAHQKELTTMDLASREKVAGMQLAGAMAAAGATVSAATISANTSMANTQANLAGQAAMQQNQIAAQTGWNAQQVAANASINQSQLGANAVTNYTSQFTSIMNNPDLTPDGRSNAIASLNAVWQGSPYLPAGIFQNYTPPGATPPPPPPPVNTGGGNDGGA